MLLKSYHQFWEAVAPQRIKAYTEGRTSWLKGLSPEAAVTWPLTTVLTILRRRLGERVVENALDRTQSTPSPKAEEPNGNWLKTTNVVGVNVRTIGSFAEIVKYALTLPHHVGGIHLLPIWEPGVVGSLYGVASWQLNPEFYSQELADLGMEQLEDQLRVVVNLLHAMGKVVGMDVIPHTDRYSEIVLANPDHFEWIRRRGTTIVDQQAALHEAAQGAIHDWLLQCGPAEPTYGVVGHLWQLPEGQRLRLLFGAPKNYQGRQQRRVSLVDWLYRQGLEPAPATMAPPYRGLEVDPSPEALTIDAAGREWRDYRITAPQPMSRVFGPLTRYKLYGRVNDNRGWEIDFERPRAWVWDYLTEHYAAQRARYNFDFMRGDMSHVQMRPGGVPDRGQITPHYDPLLAVKQAIQRSIPHFAYFAESFLAEDGHMAYGNEVAHLERSGAEVTLGNLQSTVAGSDAFWDMARHYLEVASSSAVTPAWTVITGDKDDPRFDHFHHFGERERVFTGLFLGLLPMYFSLGFEQRDRHFERATNEVYSKLYVFREERGEKAVSGPYRWGGNLALFANLTNLHAFAEGILPHLGSVRVLRVGPVLAWLRSASDGDGAYLFLVTFGQPAGVTGVDGLGEFTTADLLFATDGSAHHRHLIADGLLQLRFGGSRCYRII